MEQLADSRLDTTHPQTAYRIGLMELRNVDTPKYQLTEQDLRQLGKS